MIVRRQSQFSGVVHEMDLPITKEQIENYNQGMLVQYAFPHLSREEREFILTGITPQEWQFMFATDDDEQS